jgi:protein-disulfide isomerase
VANPLRAEKRPVFATRCGLSSKLLQENAAMSRITILLVATTLMLQGAVAYKLLSITPPPETVAVPRIHAVDAVIDIAGMPAQGAPDAPLALIEFLDFQCPFCKRHAGTVHVDIKKMFVDSGRLKYVVANYPLVDIHPSAELMAVAAICADRQCRFWDMRERLFATQPSTTSFALTLVRELGIDDGSFEECMAAGAQDAIARDMSLGQALGVQSTPSFAIGVVERDGRVRVSSLIRGVQPLRSFEQFISALLGENDVPVE